MNILNDEITNRITSDMIADQLLNLMRSSLVEQKNTYIYGLRLFWQTEGISPQDILTSLGNKAPEFLAISSMQLTHLNELTKGAFNSEISMIKRLPIEIIDGHAVIVFSRTDTT